MSLDFSTGVVTGQKIFVSDWKRPWQQLLVQSGYQVGGDDSNDFGGFVGKVGTGAPYVPLGIGAKEHLRLIAPSDDPGAHAPWRVTTSLAVSQLSGQPVYDPVLSIGYNAAAEGNPVNVADASWTLQWEADWHDGNSRKMEFYLQYIAANAVTSFRPYMFQVDRVTHEVTQSDFMVGRTTGFRWINGNLNPGNNRDEIGVLTEGVLSLNARNAGHDTQQVVVSTKSGKLRGLGFHTLTGTFGVDEVGHDRVLIAVDGAESGSDTGSNFRLALYLDNGTAEDVLTIARAAASPITTSRALFIPQLWFDADPAAPFIKANTGSHSLQIFNKRTVSGQFVVLDVTDGQPVTLVSPTSDGSTKSALVIDTHTALAAADTRLLTLKNAGTEKAYIDKSGAWVGGGGTFSLIAGAGQVMELKQDRGATGTAILFTDTNGTPAAQMSLSLSGANIELVQPGNSRIAKFGVGGIEFDFGLMVNGAHDIEFALAGQGPIMRSANNTRYRVVVSNAGALSTVAA